MRQVRGSAFVMTAAAVAAAAPAAAAVLPSRTTMMSISGRITGSATGAGVPGMCVEAENSSLDSVVSAQAPSDSNGYYRITFRQPTGSEDTWYVSAVANCGANGWWQLTTGGPVDLTATPGHNTATGVNMVTKRAGRIVGRITDSVTGAPVGGAYLEDGGTARTDSAGRFILGGLPGGNSTVLITLGDAQAKHYLAEWFHHEPIDTLADRVSVTVGHDTVMDETLLHPDTIRGKVTDSRTGLPVSGVTVDIRTLSGNWPIYGDTMRSRLGETEPITTRLDGSFTITDLGPGSYAVCFRDTGTPSLYGSRCWKNKAYPWQTQRNAWSNATPVRVTGFGNTVSIQQALPLGPNR